MQEFISYSEEDTINFADKFAENLNKNSVIILSGDLGSGKTKFTEGILKHFGLEDEISSPTFTIVNEYHSDNMNIYHFDLYRLSDIDEFYAMGGEEYFEKGICIIEWGETILEALPKEYIHIFLEKSSIDENTRILKVKAIGEKYEKILDIFKEEL